VTEVIKIRVGEEEAESWRRQAAEAGLSISAWVRRRCERQVVTFTPDDLLTASVNVASGKRTYTPDPKPGPKKK
jgi:hypothetical protein